MISIIIPYFNAKDTLLNVALNAINQLFEGSELLLVDDGSDDQSSIHFSEIQRTAEERGIILNQVIIAQNSGLLAARIAGAKAAKFSYVGFLDADDYIFNFNPAEIEYIIENNFDVAIYRFLYCDQMLRVHDELTPPAKLSAETAFRYNLMSWTYTTMGVYKKDLYISCENLFLSRSACSEEVYFKYLFIKVKKIFKSNIEYYYVQNPHSNSKSINVKRITKILSYNCLVERMKDAKCSAQDIFLASTCTLNIAVEQARIISNMKRFDVLMLARELAINIATVFWGRKGWIRCLHLSFPWVSFKNILKLSWLLLFCLRSS